MSLRLGKTGKQKTHKGASKRVRRTKGGKGEYMMEKVACRHLLLQKSKRQKAKASTPLPLAKGDAKRMASIIS